MSVHTVTASPAETCAPGRAARELGLKRSELDLAARLGRIRTVPDEGGGGRRVPRAEIDRLSAEPGFPEALRESVRTVGTREAAELMEVAPTRFTRFARAGLVVPVTFYLNRYRAVVWRYLANELRAFAAAPEHAGLLHGPTPETLRGPWRRAWTCGPATGAAGTSASCCGRPRTRGSAPAPWPPCWTPCTSRRSSPTPTSAPTSAGSGRRHPVTAPRARRPPCSPSGSPRPTTRTRSPGCGPT